MIPRRTWRPIWSSRHAVISQKDPDDRIVSWIPSTERPLSLPTRRRDGRSSFLRTRIPGRRKRPAGGVLGGGTYSAGSRPSGPRTSGPRPTRPDPCAGPAGDTPPTAAWSAESVSGKGVSVLSWSAPRDPAPAAAGRLVVWARERGRRPVRRFGPPTFDDLPGRGSAHPMVCTWTKGGGRPAGSSAASLAGLVQMSEVRCL